MRFTTKLLLVTALGFASAAAGAAASAVQTSPLPEDGDDAALASYCLFTTSMALQRMARGDPMAALRLVSTAQAWQTIVSTVLPETDARGAEMANSMTVFNARVAAGLAAASGDEALARQAVFDEAEASCAPLLARAQSSGLQPRTTAGAVTPEVALVVPSIRQSAREDTQSPGLQPQPTPVTRPQGSPFHKDVFAPGWRGDLLWQGGKVQERAVLTSHDAFPPGKDSPAIHANLRIFGANARQHCVAALVESGSSPDGLALHMRPAPGNACGATDRVVTMFALADDRMRIEIHEGGVVLAVGDFAPTQYSARLAMSAAAAITEAKPATPATTAPETGVASSSASTAIQPAAAAPNATRATQPSAGPTNTCATCAPGTPFAPSGQDDPFDGFFAAPLTGRFGWDWLTTGLVTARAQGTLRQSSAPGVPYAFSLDLDAEYKAICVGQLRETGRSADGHILHLAVQMTAASAHCQPAVSNALLLPFVVNGRSEFGALWMLLYDQSGSKVSEGILRLEPMRRLEASAAQRTWQAYEAMKDGALNQLRAQKVSAFQASAEYPRIKHLYDACMQVVPDRNMVHLPASYCQCVAQKFGIGGRIPASEFNGYARDASVLIDRMHGVENAATAMYTRLGKTCRACGFADSELETWCAERDDLLYAAFNYADMIRLLDVESPTVDASDYYKKVFFRDYLQGFSIFCPKQIVDPVPFVYTVTEHRVGDPWAPAEGQVIQRTETNVARVYAPRYKRFRGETERKGAPGMGMARTEGQLNRQIQDVQEFMQTELSNRGAVRTHLEGQCESTSVRRVYGNLSGLVR